MNLWFNAENAAGYVPPWELPGELTEHYTVEHDPEPRTHTLDSALQSFLTINAIDGSLIDTESEY